MKVVDIIRRSGRNLRQAKARTLLTSLAIGVGAFALTMTLAASNGAESYVNKVIRDNFDPAELIVAKDEAVLGRADANKPIEYDESVGVSTAGRGAAVQVKQLTQQDVDKIRTYKSVEQVREGVALNLQYIKAGNSKKYIGTAEGFSPAQNPELIAGKIDKPLGDRQLLLPEAYIAPLGFKSANEAIGKNVTLAVRKTVDPQTLTATDAAPVIAGNATQQVNQSTVETEFIVSAILKKPATSQPGTELYMYISNDSAKELNDIINEGTPQFRKYTFAYVRVKDGQDNTKLKAVQAQLKWDGFASQSVEDTQQFLTQIIDVLKGIVVAFGIIAIIASVFGVVNTMYISVLQRTREIGLMKALGIRRRDISRLFRFEAAWIGFLGGLIGAVLAYIIGTLLNPWITDKLDLGSQELLIFDFKQIATLIIALVFVAIFAGLLPARKASKLDPIEALRTE